MVKVKVLFSLTVLFPIGFSTGASLGGEGNVQLEVSKIKQVDEQDNVPPGYPLVIQVWLLSFAVSHTSDIPSSLGDWMMLSPQ